MAIQNLKSIVVKSLGGPESRATNIVRSALGRGASPKLGQGMGVSQPEVIDPVDIERENKHRYGAVTLSPDRIPTNFSVNLGVAPCNHSCLFCPQSIKKPKKAHWLDLELLRKVLHEMPEEGVLLNISSYSETLAAPNLVGAVQMMKEIRPKLEISMATNGSLFRENVIRGLLEAGLDHYQYSFDAPTRDTFNRMMQIDHFDRVEANLERIIKLRDDIGGPTFITTHVMGFQELEDENKKFVERWNAKLTGDKDFANIRRVSNWGGQWQLEQNLVDAGFTTKPGETPDSRYPCSLIFMHFKIQHDGRYAPCVVAVPDYIPEEERHTVPYLGNAQDVTWGEAWEKLGEMRRAHLEGRWDGYDCCKTCDVWANLKDFWDDHGEQADGHSRFTVIGDFPHVDDGKGSPRI